MRRHTEVRDSTLDRRSPHRRDRWMRHWRYRRIDDRTLDPDGEAGILSVRGRRAQTGNQNEEQQILELHASTSMRFERFRRGCSKTGSLYCAYTLVYTFSGMNTTLLLAQLLETVDRDFLVNDPARTLREIAQKLDRVVERHRHELTKIRKPNAKRGSRARPAARKA